MLTSTGSFKTDKDGFLTTDSGLTLLGWPADNNGKVAQQPRDTSNGLVPVHINTSAVAMEPTAKIGLNVNLPTDDVTAGAMNFSHERLPRTHAPPWKKISTGSAPSSERGRSGT